MMQYKIYTLQHQKLYDQIHSVTGGEKIQKIINKETVYLLDRCKELRRDFSALSKVRELDALFTDVLVMNKKKTYSFEQIVVIANKVYVLERKKHYDNQRQLLKEKVAYLRKALGKNIHVDFYILVDGKTTKPNNIKLDTFIEMCRTQHANDGISGRVNAFVQSKHVSLDITDYIHKKYNVNITHTEVKRSSKWIEILSFSNPIISKYKGNLSFLSSAIIFFYVLTAIFTYSIYAKEKQFLLTIAIDIMFLFILVNILKEMESKLPKLLKFFMQIGTLSVFVFFFARIIYYF